MIFLISFLIAIILLSVVEAKFLFKHLQYSCSLVQEEEQIEINTDNENTLQLFKNAVEFSSVKLSACSIPRTDLVAVENTDSLPHLTQKFIESGYSKILVYDGSLDNIIGYVHISDMFKQPQTIEEIVRNIEFASETMKAKLLMKLLISNKQSIAVVVDEFGGTEGIVTIEDILEEIFGEIEDEFDRETLEEKRLNKNEFVFSARHEVAYINNKYFFTLPLNKEYETLAGLFLYHYPKFPQTNAQITLNKTKLTILKILGTKIELIHIKKL